MYPPLENIPPKPQEVDACLKRIFYEQERVKQEALVEQRRLAAEQERIAEEALKVERKRIAEEQRRVEEAALRAAQEMPAAEVFLPFSLVGFLLQ